MTVVVRVDASLEIGTGHVMRCLALADRLRTAGTATRFVCRVLDGHLCDLVEARGYAVARLSRPTSSDAGDCEPAHARWLHVPWQKDAQETLGAMAAEPGAPAWLIVDHYGLDARWESAVRPVATRLAAIDDLGDRPHDCDLLVAPGLVESPAIPAASTGARTVLAGPSYAPLRPEFDQVPLRLRDQGLRRVLVFFGGSDATNETQKVVEAWRQLGDDAPMATAVLGPANPHTESVRRAATGLSRLEVIPPTREMARLLAAADVAIGACGTAALERCAVGLPALVAITAENQREEALQLERRGAIRVLGDAATITADDWARAINALRGDHAILRAMSAAAADVMHGWREAGERLVSSLMERDVQ